MVVDKPLLRTVSPPTVRPPVVIETELLCVVAVVVFRVATFSD